MPGPSKQLDKERASNSKAKHLLFPVSDGICGWHLVQKAEKGDLVQAF